VAYLSEHMLEQVAICLGRLTLLKLGIIACLIEKNKSPIIKDRDSLFLLNLPVNPLAFLQFYVTICNIKRLKIASRFFYSLHSEC
jgi:hypothetical protein